jgi:hypothetical protein
VVGKPHTRTRASRISAPRASWEGRLAIQPKEKLAMTLHRSTSTTTRTALIGVVAAFAAMALTAARAEAGSVDGLDYVTAKAALKSEQQRTLPKRCPKGTRVVGGGVTGTQVHGAMQVTETAPRDSRDPNSTPEDGWVGAIDNLSVVKATIKVEAICGSGDYRYVSFSNQVPAQDSASTFATCPVGRKMISGGIAGAGGPGQFTIEGFAPSGVLDSWWTVASNHTLASQPITVYGVCAYGRVTQPAKQVTLGASKRSQVKVTCPAGSHATGGGLDPFPTPITLNGSASFDGRDRDRVPDDGWRMVADNYDSVSHPATAFAICMR